MRSILFNRYHHLTESSKSGAVYKFCLAVIWSSVEKNYYCEMREQLLTALGKQIILDDGVIYHYIISQIEVENALGAVVAVLDEFIITDEAGNAYKLHKTKEGNWYDLDTEKNTFQQSVLQRLKRAIDNTLKEISE